MTGDVYYHVFEAGGGFMAALADPRGLRRLILPQVSAAAARAALAAPPGARAAPSRFEALTAALERYFKGEEPVDLDLTLNIEAGTPFQRRVWKTLRDIPYGETWNYGRVAALVSRPGGARAVGQAVGRNPLPILVPCHRVVGASGLGGFSGGLEMKRRLLALEAGARR